jgi:hypothetical protein
MVKLQATSINSLIISSNKKCYITDVQVACVRGESFFFETGCIERVINS